MNRWIQITTLLLALLALVVGGTLYISPESGMPDVNFSAPGAVLLAQLWAARQIAIALVIGYAAIRQSVPMLKTTLAVYCIMNLQDIFIGLNVHDTALAAGAAFFSALSGFMLFKLNTPKYIKEGINNT